MGVVVNNSDAQSNLQALLELCEEDNQREQSSHSHRNLDWGNLDKVPGGWEFVGYDGAHRVINYIYDSNLVDREVSN